MAAVEKPAAVTPGPQVGAKDVIETSQNGKENTNESPRESLLEKLRAKAKHYKPWGDMAKALRMAIMEKHHLVDSAERSQLQKCLDMIQKSIKVTSMQSMIERLDTITRQQGLMFTTGPGGQECFISSDMFYVEVLLEPSGTVNDVKISHHGDPLSCPELTQVLLRGDFAEFTKHLEGLASIYQLNADKKQKTKAYLALQALETDLSILSQLQSFMNEPSNLVHKSPVGILQPRKGGHPMKLTFFISPYDLLDVDSQSSIPLTVEAILEKGLGHSVSVCIESSGSHKLQTTSLISVTNTPEGKNLPSFAALSNLNSTMLPASFVLKLPKPIPMAVALVRKIHAVTLIECADTSTTQPLLSLIINQASEGKLSASSDRGLNVTLPDQQHCYYLLSGSPELPGVMVSGVPFTHPTHVPQILVFLRQQLLFNTLVASCVRPSSRQNAEMSHMFEVNTTSISNISISFEHPLDESLATVDLNLSEITSVKCRIYTLNSDISICTDEYASKVMQRCLSIPVTMRAVIRKAQGQRARMSSQGDSYCNALNSSGNTYLTGLPGYGPNPATGSFGDFTPAGKADGYRESEEEPGTLGSLLGGPLPSQSPNMMLMSMLSDVPSASNSPAAPGFPFLGQAKPRNKRKRKATTSSDGRSPKRREDDGGGTDPEEEPFLESEAGQNKAALLNPAEPAGATAESATDDTASFLRGAGGALFPEEGADPGDTNRPPGRKVKRVRSEEAREDIKLEREGSRSQDSGPKNLLPGGDSDKLSRSASPPVSFKIEKSGDSLKISKTESKSGSKPRDSSELRKKMDNKKERKRKRAESVDSGCRQPAVAASPEPLELSQQAFNLTTKPHGSMSPSTSRPPLKKSASSLVSNGKKLAKPLQPAPSSGIKSSTETDNRPIVKSPQKSSPSKPVSSVSGSSYVPSSSPVTKQPPSSPTGTLKLKHLNLPSSTTITPVVAKPSLPSPTSTAPPSITIVPTTSVAGGSNNLNKPPKSRKGCLNAVIAKLTNTMASPLVGPPVPELPGSRPDITLKSCEKRDSPTLSKEVKEGRTPSAEGSTVKEGSGIKLTVTKTSGIYKCSSGKAKMGASSSKGSLSSGPKVKSSQKLSGLPVGVPAKKLPTKSPAKLSPSQGFNPCDSGTPSALPTLVPRVAHNNAGSLKNSPKLAAMSKAGVRPEKKPSETTKPIVEKEATSLMPPPLHSRTGPKSVEGGQPLSDEAALRMLLGPGESPDDDQWRALKGNVGSEEHLATKAENGPEVGPVALTVPRVTPEVRTSEDKGPTTALPLPVSLTKAAPAAAAPAGDDDSSPEDGLVIDFAMDSKKVAPPVCHSPPRPLEPVMAPDLPARASPALSLSAKSPYFVPSPSLKSPQAGSPPSNHSVSSSLSRPSPCVIDDDLMDEAIVGLGK